MKLSLELGVTTFLLCAAISFFHITSAEDPYKSFNRNVTYGDIYPLGVRQTGILINGQFPGPDIHSVTNDNLTLAFHKAAGGFGGIRILSRPRIPVPFPDPSGDYTVLIGDWYKSNHTTLKPILIMERSFLYLMESSSKSLPRLNRLLFKSQRHLISTTLSDSLHEASFNNIRIWIRNIEQHASDNVNKILVGNKADMDESKRAVPTSKGQALADEYGIKFFETSAKTNMNKEEERDPRRLRHKIPRFFFVQHCVLLHRPDPLHFPHPSQFPF